MHRFATLVMAAALLSPAQGCKEVAEEVADEAGEVIRDQKHKVVESAQDAAISTLDEQREKAAGALSGESTEESGSADETY